jgi:hypothetical protein
VAGTEAGEPTYEPDLLDVLTTGVQALGGSDLMQHISSEATAYTDEQGPWNGEGDEPPERYSAWLAYLG